MKNLIQYLQKGLPSGWTRLIRQRPDQVIELLQERSAAIKLGGDKLAEATYFVARLVSPDVTFGEQAAAKVWLEKNKDL